MNDQKEEIKRSGDAVRRLKRLLRRKGIGDEGKGIREGRK